MLEQGTSAGGWSSCQLAEHLEEVRRCQLEMRGWRPWLIADPLLLEAMELLSAAVAGLIEHHDGLYEADLLAGLVRVVET